MLPVWSSKRYRWLIIYVTRHIPFKGGIVMSPRARMEYPDHLLKIQKSLSKTKDSDPFMVNFAKNFGYVAVVLRQVFPLGATD